MRFFLNFGIVCKKTLPLGFMLMSEISDNGQKSVSKEAVSSTALSLSGRWWWYVSIGAVAIAFGLGLLAIIELIARPLAIIAMGVVVAMAFAPVTEFFGRWLPRTVAILLAYLIFVLIITGIGFIVFPPLIDQAQEASSDLPDLIDNAQNWMEQLSFLDSESLVDTVRSQLGNFTSTLVRLPIAIFSSLLDILLVLVISLYWLIQLPKMKRFTLSLFPASEKSRVGDVLAKMGQAMGGFIRAAVINGIIVGLLTYIALTIIGVDFPLVLALLAGVLEIIPVVGPIIAGTIIVLIALLQSLTIALIVLIFEVVMQQVENNVLVPNIMRTQAEISPLLTLLALFVGSAVGGVLGALVAIPLAAALSVVVVEVIGPMIRRWSGPEKMVENKGEMDGEDS